MVILLLRGHLSLPPSQAILPLGDALRPLLPRNDLAALFDHFYNHATRTGGWRESRLHPHGLPNGRRVKAGGPRRTPTLIYRLIKTNRKQVDHLDGVLGFWGFGVLGILLLG